MPVGGARFKWHTHACISEMGEQDVWVMSDVTQVPDPDASANGASAALQQAPAPQMTPQAQPEPQVTPQLEPHAMPFDPAHAMTRLLVGVALEGSDELMRRVKQWEAGARTMAETASLPPETSQAAEF